jgi:protein gp37
MSNKTGISWCDATFNPWWGCAHVSPGCVHCYAETLAARYGSDVWGKTAPRRLFGEAHWRQPLAWNRKAEREGKPIKVFCASMADVFEPHRALIAERVKLWKLVAETPWLDWQLLTKRPEYVPEMVPMRWLVDGFPSNVWLGTSVEDQQRADERVPMLLGTSGIAVRFLSVEPLIGPVSLAPHLEAGGIGWIIVGGESGPRRREMKHAWLYRVVAEADGYGIPLFVKQDSGARPGARGGIHPDLWARKEFPR